MSLRAGRIVFVLAGLLAALAALAAGTPAPAADGVATWNGSTGPWTDSTRWDTHPLWPCNGNGGLTFDVVIPGGSLTLDQDVEVQALALAAGTLAGTGSLTVREGFTWTGGSLGGSGTLRAEGGLLLGGAGEKFLDRMLEGAGSAVLQGTGNFGGNGWGVFRNLAGGSFDVREGASMLAVPARPVFENLGTFLKSGAGTCRVGWTLNNSGLVDVRSGTLSLEGGGVNSGRFTVAPGAGVRFLRTHVHTAGGRITGGGTVDVAGGIQMLPADLLDFDGSLVLSGGFVYFEGPQRVGALTVAAGGHQVTPGAGPLVVGSLAIDASRAVLDLGDNALILDYADGAASPAAQVVGWLRTGLNWGAGGYWNGLGLTSTVAAAEPFGTTALGAVDNRDGWVGGKTTFAGRAVDASSVLVKYTYWGDANLDGVVNFDDYDVTDYYYWFPPPPAESGWWNGDYNYDGHVTLDDYDLLDYAYWFQGGPLGGAAVALEDRAAGAVLLAGPAPHAAPEPGALLLLAGGAVLAAWRRRG